MMKVFHKNNDDKNDYNGDDNENVYTDEND